ncbi:hypothetical protein F5J12DRAFT_102704 [Pisolithus orientalis]|uniref:uncharacterized protein n=1 Tax=Pisolithus orientalis TaxID=936130 RepID=UPI0022250361|nr:uncharacterized protein F5J12DRAFT_102704 [Pisolithus orientalis]KAI6006666.1 hypothetical protein F5J12DRAFT_102704 [Pisolithus orientalis]
MVVNDRHLVMYSNILVIAILMQTTAALRTRFWSLQGVSGSLICRGRFIRPPPSCRIHSLLTRSWPTDWRPLHRRATCSANASRSTFPTS